MRMSCSSPGRRTLPTELVAVVGLCLALLASPHPAFAQHRATLGKRLAGLAEDILNADAATAKTGLMTLLDVQSAVNLRTAKHLGINPMRLKSFDTSFPE